VRAGKRLIEVIGKSERKAGKLIVLAVLIHFVKIFEINRQAVDRGRGYLDGSRKLTDSY